MGQLKSSLEVFMLGNSSQGPVNPANTSLLSRLTLCVTHMHAHTYPHASHAIVVIAMLRTKLVYVFLEISGSSLHTSSCLRYYCNSDDDLYAYHQSLQGSRRLPSGDFFTCTMWGFCCNIVHAGICHFLAF